MAMKFEQKNPPRTFVVGNKTRFEIRDCGTLRLQADEQVTFLTDSGAEYDVIRKEWGFYATPSLNSRLASFSLRAVLIRNITSGHYFILLVERGREQAFEGYMEQEGLEIISWLDDKEVLDSIKDKMRGSE